MITYPGKMLLRCLGASVLMLSLTTTQAAEALPGFVDGLVPGTVDATVEQIKAKLIEQNCRVYRVIDHAASARGAGLELRDMKVVMFSSDALDEYVLSHRQLAALDLPQKLLVRSLPDGTVQIDSKPASRFYTRHGIKLGDRYVRMIENKARQFTADPGIVTYQSMRAFDTTVTDLVNAIKGTKGFGVAGDPIDYTVAAQRPTKLIVAGAPAVGTLLLQARGSIGLDLPLKLLVWQDENGAVQISYNAPSYLAKTYDITTADEVFKGMATRLRGFAAAAGAIVE